MNDDPTSGDFGGCIKHYLEKLAPGQTRIYTKCILSDPSELRAIDLSGNLEVFYANQLIRNI